MLSITVVGRYIRFDAVETDMVENVLVLNMTTCALVFLLQTIRGKLLSRHVRYGILSGRRITYFRPKPLDMSTKLHDITPQQTSVVCTAN